MKTKQVNLANVRDGGVFTYGGCEWVKLETMLDGTLCITKNVVCGKAFDEGNHNDWRGSTLRKWLNGDFLRSLRKNGAEARDMLPIISDLTSDDGIRDYGTAEDAIALMSADQYRKYRGLLPALYVPWWTLTPLYINRDNASDSYGIRYVVTTGMLGSSHAYYGSRGVRPLCNLNSEIYISTEEPEPGGRNRYA